MIKRVLQQVKCVVWGYYIVDYDP